ncbi:MAG TPA: TetR/AcrR family transcriptional regulator [Steroidobacteraceae bacterium]
MTASQPARNDSATSDATKERIAATALHILECEGAEAVSMRRIATAVGITPMAIYHYFPNREALLRSIVDDEFGALLEFITRTPKFSSLESEMTHIMDSYIDYAFARPHIFDYVFAKPRCDARRFPQDFRARRSPTLNPIADTVARWMQHGEIKQDDVWETALEIWAHAHGYLMLQRAGRFDLSPLAFKKLLHRSLKRLLYGLKG